MEIILFLMLFSASVLIYKSSQQESLKDSAPEYETVNNILTVDEIDLYNKINRVIAKDELCCMKVSADTCLRPIVTGDASAYLHLMNKLANQYFDFVICKKPTLRPVLAIMINHDVDDLADNHNRLTAPPYDNKQNSPIITHVKVNQEQIKFLKKSCLDAGLPLIFISANSLNNSQSLKETISPYVNVFA